MTCPVESRDGGVCIPRVPGPPDLALLGPDGQGRLPGFARVAGFVQRLPTDGAPASERTAVYLGYDDGALYAVFAAYDRSPGAVRARMVPRESIGGDDQVTLLLDTDDDSRRAYAFRTNPLGVQWDALYTEGQGYDTSYDAVWTSEGRVTDWGYVVRMEIPFKSLRFPPTDEQRWRIVLSRLVSRGSNEDAYWPRVSSAVQGTLTQSAPLDGMTDISPGRNLQVIPYATFRSYRALDRGAQGGPDYVTDLAEPDAGLDFKAILDDRFVLDVTANPDFSQVESDLPQVTVNQRFEVFYPERRPFFTENADYFQTPINLLFTRRIQDPQVGTRFTGKAGGWGLGALVIDDQAPGRTVSDDDPLAGERAWFGTARVSRDIGRHSTIGGMYVGRELPGDHNRVGGLDGRLRFDDHWTSSAQLALSHTDLDGETSGAPAYFLSLSRSDRRLSLATSYTDNGVDNDARSGFVPRTDIRRFTHFSSFFWRPEDMALVSWGPEFLFQRIWDHDGTLLDAVTEGSLEWNFVGSSSIEVNSPDAVERLRPIDHPAITETRGYDIDSWDIEYSTSIVDWFSLGGNVRFG
ncbi:MAG: DUF5916 domain-containing protein, partial [Gemmatimonadota bacterium]|nr:DUF5916 domain-containing protein [Gemmatimonadota bacterium]